MDPTRTVHKATASGTVAARHESASATGSGRRSCHVVQCVRRGPGTRKLEEPGTNLRPSWPGQAALAPPGSSLAAGAWPLRPDPGHTSGTPVRYRSRWQMERATECLQPEAAGCLTRMARTKNTANNTNNTK